MGILAKTSVLTLFCVYFTEKQLNLVLRGSFTLGVNTKSAEISKIMNNRCDPL